MLDLVNTKKVEDEDMKQQKVDVKRDDVKRDEDVDDVKRRCQGG